MINCMIGGVGGQGTVLASKLIAAAAIHRGLDVRTTETIGMAQRGGCVVSHIRIGNNIHSPLIPLGGADVIIAYEPAEAVRIIPYLSKEGLLIVCDTAIIPTTGYYQASEMIDYLKKNVKRLVVIDGQQLIKSCTNAKTHNVALIGSAIESGVLPFSADDMKCVIQEMIPKRFLESNLNSFEVGRRMYHAE